MRTILAALAALLFGAAAAPGLSHAAPARYTPGPCATSLTPELKPRVSCGTLVVDETRGANNGRRVALPVAIVKAANPRGLPPVIFLHGGPGGGVVSGLPRQLQGAGAKTWVAQDQDWVFFDQRGGVLSAPNLDCGHLPLNDAGPTNDAVVGALKACAARYAAAGFDLSRYNAVEVAHDVQDLRDALGFKSFDVFGVSYGSRMALEVVRTAPQGVRAVILDSLWPPEAKWAEDGAMPVANAVRQIIRHCEADPACAKDKPDLEARVDAMTRRWLEGPLTGKDGRSFPVEDFAQYMMDEAYDAGEGYGFTDHLQQFASGDFTALAEYDEDRSPYIEGQHLTHLCKEQFPFESREKTIANAGADPLAQAETRTMVRYFDACAGFPVGPIDRAQGQPVASGLPILIVNSDTDPGCPPSLARAAVKRFPRGKLLIVANSSHGVTRSEPCAASAAQGFLRDPSAPLATSCTGAEAARLTFEKR